MIDSVNWKKLAEPIPSDAVQWRQQGKPKARDGKWFAPFVAYIDAQLVRERLDSIFEGQWNTALELLPMVNADGNGEALEEPVAFKCRLTVRSVTREDVGTGRDYKNAATDAFKRAAMRFGIGHELYTDYEILWVQVDSDSKYAKPVEDPGEAYARRQQRGSGVKSAEVGKPHTAASTPAARQQAAPDPAPASPLDGDEISCPKCGGRMWDNRLSKRNPKQPDYKCRDKSCDGVIWPPRNAAQRAAQSVPARGVDELPEDFNSVGGDDLPFD